MTPAFLSAFATGGTLVTANTRLARDGRSAWDWAQISLGKPVWDSPDILPWNAWIERTWLSSDSVARGAAPVLLNPSQEQLLWEQVITESPGAENLHDVVRTAREARKAYDLLLSWELRNSEAEFSRHDDSWAFLGWMKEFEERLGNRGWIVPAQLQAELSKEVRNGAVRLPSQLKLAGFDEITPAQRTLHKALSFGGCTVSTVDPPSTPVKSAVRAGLITSSEEIRSAAQWARNLLAHDAHARIGIAVLDLAGRERMVERIFDETLHPSLAVSSPSWRRAFHLSSGGALAECPLVSTALSLLRLAQGNLGIGELGVILRTPFLVAASEESTARALLDAELRRKGFVEIGLEDLLRVMGKLDANGKARPWHSPRLEARLRNLRQQAPSRFIQQSASEWSRRFSRMLDAVGWPGDRPLNGLEYQAVERWNSLLSEFASLDLIAGPSDYSAAQARLRHLASRARLSLEGETAPVQIMDLADAAGSVFDHLWVSGLEDRVWPAGPRPHPFLPLTLQREHGLPHSSAEREIGYARRTTDRLLAAASDVVMSFPRRDGDNELRPSPLIQHLTSFEPPAPTENVAGKLRRSFSGLEHKEDEYGPALRPGGVQQGGKGIFEKQAACPFRSFAEYRLRSRELDEPEPGLTALDRGNVLHVAMERIWSELKTYAALVALTEFQLTDLIRRAVGEAVAQITRGRGSEALSRLQALERNRLERMIGEWLQGERKRSPFEVAALESSRHVRLGGMDIEIKVDRVDILPDGRHVILDYKTGDPTPSEWDGDRPDSPQLPLYAVRHEAPIAAVSFARICAKSTTFKGLGERSGIPGLVELKSGETLAARIDEWSRTLEKLASDYAGGLATVAPKRTNTCRNCHLPALCRVAELGVQLEDDFLIMNNFDE